MPPVVPPPATDDWKPKHAKRAKRFGMRVTYGPAFRGEMLVWCEWYASERARKQALAAVEKNAKITGSKYSAEPI